ncbi:Ig-like domain-containing protein [Sulfurimonas diazotrophicus]|uniref:Ig-like domain-containing protein n=1 Tax=Sulfurimonas diazotrophicus TaxID=3131939 RepID=A0ABZ3HB32_9BACT
MKTSKYKWGLTGILGMAMVLILAGCGRDSAFDDNVNGGELQVAVDPSEGAVNVPINKLITAKFNKEMNVSTVNDSTFYLLDENGTKVSSTIKFYGTDTKLFTLTSNADLVMDSNYTVYVTRGVKASDGYLLAADNIIHFRTGTLKYLQVTVLPNDGDTNVSIGVHILGNFNEAVNTATLNSTNVYLRESNGSFVNGTINYSDVGDDHLMTFTPSVPLDYNATYTFTIKQPVTSLTGLQLEYDSVNSFTTGPMKVVQAAVFSMAASPVAVDTNNSEVLGSVLGGLLGTQASVDLLGSGGLAGVSLGFPKLVSDLVDVVSASTVEDLVDSNVTLDAMLRVIADELEGLDAAEAHQLVIDLREEVNASGLSDTPISVGSLLQFPVDTLPMQVNDVLSMTGLSAAQLSVQSLLGGINQALAPVLNAPIEVPLSLPLLTDESSGLKLQVITPPAIAVMKEGDTIHSASTRLQLNLKVGGILGDLLGALNTQLDGEGAVSADLINLPLYLELGSSEANLTVLNNDEIAMNVRNGLATLVIGTIPEDQFFSQQPLSPEDVGSADLVNLLGLVKITVKAYASGVADSGGINFLPVDMQQMQSVYAPTGSTTGALLNTLVSNLELTINLLGIPIDVSGLLGSLLDPLLSILLPLLSPLLDSVTGLLGASIGKADVTMMSLIYGN